MTDEQRGPLKDFWGPGMRATPQDREVVDELAPNAADWMLTKWRYSAFFRSNLLDRMRELGRDQLIVRGVYAHVGVLMSVVDAFTNDIQPFLVADAVADFSPDCHRLAVEYAAQRCAVTAHVVPPSVWQRVTSPYPSTQDPGYAAALKQQAREVLADRDHPVFTLVDRPWLADLVERDISRPSGARRGIDRVLDLYHWLDIYRPRLVL